MPEGIRKTQKELILRILRTHLPNVRVLAFGSRIDGTHRTYSDLDLAVDDRAPIDLKTFAGIREILAEANELPFKVDLIDFHLLDAEFQTHIESNCRVW